MAEDQGNMEFSSRDDGLNKSDTTIEDSNSIEMGGIQTSSSIYLIIFLP